MIGGGGGAMENSGGGGGGGNGNQAMAAAGSACTGRDFQTEECRGGNCSSVAKDGEFRFNIIELVVSSCQFNID